MIRYPLTGMAKPRMTKADTWKKRPIVLKYWEYKDSIKNWAFQNNFRLGNEIYCIFHIPMPKSWSLKKKQQMNYQDHQQRPDIDNLLKGLMDALLEEDSHIHTVYARKIWSEQGCIEFYKKTNLLLS
jgi:Holliday junction resolvase RusA-like endonuclease|tara:strand:- start:29 stop:409 length:381 start_codon:yes stop_codon:yes gene_type:complete